MKGDRALGEALRARLRLHADPARAERDRLYHKSSWEHWGVAAPDMDKAVAEILSGQSPEARMSVAAGLWRESVWDLRIVAARALASKATPADETVWRFVTERMADLDGWAIADCLADVGSRCLVAEPGRLDEVEPWVESSHLWTRRGSLVFTLAWTKPGRDPERMLGWAARLRSDREWFIQKAIGWWLRELGKRNPERVKMFLAAPGAPLAGFARREAIKYLDGHARQRAK